MPALIGGRIRSGDIPLLLTAFFWVCWVRLFLTLFRLEKTRARTLPKTLTTTTPSLDVSRTAWAVRRVSRLVPMASCLTRAQALQIMLARQGLSTELVLGVARSASKEFLAHAWIEQDGQILIGGSERKIGTYSRLNTYGPTTA